MDRSSTSGQQEFSDTQLMRALYDVQDILERALCSFVLLGDTARALQKEERLSGDGIYIGVMKKHLTKEAMSTIKVYLKDGVITEKGIEYTWDDVPVHVVFITQEYPFFENLDFRFYMANEYKIPNPFDDYWKNREGVV